VGVAACSVGEGSTGVGVSGVSVGVFTGSVVGVGLAGAVGVSAGSDVGVAGTSVGVGSPALKEGVGVFAAEEVGELTGAVTEGSSPQPKARQETRASTSIKANDLPCLITNLHTLNAILSSTKKYNIFPQRCKERGEDTITEHTITEQGDSYAIRRVISRTKSAQ
jgi:hypothetical protein